MVTMQTPDPMLNPFAIWGDQGGAAEAMEMNCWNCEETVLRAVEEEGNDIEKECPSCGEDNLFGDVREV